MRLAASLTLLAVTGLAAGEPARPAATKADEPVAKAFHAGKAAEFLDGVGLAWTRERKCMTCHTNVPVMLARPKVAGGNDAAAKEIRKFLEDSVTSWPTKPPRNDYDVVSTAVALTWNDAATTGKLHPLTRAALDRVWKVQLADGSWKWPDCDWPPLEHDQFYGVAYVAVAVAMAPDDYRSTPNAQAGLAKIRTYLKANPTTELHHKATLLWASTKIDGLLTDAQKIQTVDELRKLQRPDGGWSLPALGPYLKNRGGEDNRTDRSDGYGTGFAVFILRQAGLSADDPVLQKGVAWLKANQRESGRWFTASPGGSKAHYVTNVGSAFAVLALDACGEKLKAD